MLPDVRLVLAALATTVVVIAISFGLFSTLQSARLASRDTGPALQRAAAEHGAPALPDPGVSRDAGAGPLSIPRRMVAIAEEAPPLGDSAPAPQPLLPSAPLEHEATGEVTGQIPVVASGGAEVTPETPAVRRPARARRAALAKRRAAARRARRPAVARSGGPANPLSAIFGSAPAKSSRE